MDWRTKTEKFKVLVEIPVQWADTIEVLQSSVQNLKTLVRHMEPEIGFFDKRDRERVSQIQKLQERIEYLEMALNEAQEGRRLLALKVDAFEASLESRLRETSENVSNPRFRHLQFD